MRMRCAIAVTWLFTLGIVILNLWEMQRPCEHFNPDWRDVPRESGGFEPHGPERMQARVPCAPCSEAKAPSGGVNASLMNDTAIQLEAVALELPSDKKNETEKAPVKTAEDLIKEYTNKVPSIVHYVWYATTTKSLEFHQMLSIYSAYLTLKPDVIYFHTNIEPYGNYWLKVKKLPTFKVIFRNPPTHIFGERIKDPVFYTSHSNVDRLKILSEFGGIYLDLDVLVTKSFDDLRRYECTVGLETPTQVCNSVIVCTKDSPYLTLWLNSFLDDYQVEEWSYNSGKVPYRLSKRYPHLVHIEEETINRPNYKELYKIWGLSTFEWKKNYAVHLWFRVWKTMSPYYKEDPNYNNIMNMESTFGQIARSILQQMNTLMLQENQQTTPEDQVKEIALSETEVEKKLEEVQKNKPPFSSDEAAKDFVVRKRFAQLQKSKHLVNVKEEGFKVSKEESDNEESYVEEVPTEELNNERMMEPAEQEPLPQIEPPDIHKQSFVDLGVQQEPKLLISDILKEQNDANVQDKVHHPLVLDPRLGLPVAKQPDSQIYDRRVDDVQQQDTAIPEGNQGPEVEEPEESEEQDTDQEEHDNIQLQLQPVTPPPGAAIHIPRAYNSQGVEAGKQVWQSQENQQKPSNELPRRLSQHRARASFDRFRRQRVVQHRSQEFAHPNSLHNLNAVNERINQDMDMSENQEPYEVNKDVPDIQLQNQVEQPPIQHQVPPPYVQAQNSQQQQGNEPMVQGKLPDVDRSQHEQMAMQQNLIPPRVFSQGNINLPQQQGQGNINLPQQQGHGNINLPQQQGMNVDTHHQQLVRPLAYKIDQSQGLNREHRPIQQLQQAPVGLPQRHTGDSASQRMEYEKKVDDLKSRETKVGIDTKIQDPVNFRRNRAEFVSREKPVVYREPIEQQMKNIQDFQKIGRDSRQDSSKPLENKDGFISRIKPVAFQEPVMKRVDVPPGQPMAPVGGDNVIPLSQVVGINYPKQQQVDDFPQPHPAIAPVQGDEDTANSPNIEHKAQMPALMHIQSPVQQFPSLQGNADLINEVPQGPEKDADGLQSKRLFISPQQDNNPAAEKASPLGYGANPSNMHPPAGENRQGLLHNMLYQQSRNLAQNEGLNPMNLVDKVAPPMDSLEGLTDDQAGYNDEDPKEAETNQEGMEDSPGSKERLVDPIAAHDNDDEFPDVGKEKEHEHQGEDGEERMVDEGPPKAARVESPFVNLDEQINQEAIGGVDIGEDSEV